MREENSHHMNRFQETLYRFCKNKVSLIGVFIIIVLIFVIIFAEQISPYDRGIKNNYKERLQGPSLNHPFGTDGYGRDIMTRVIHGAKYTMLIAFSSSILAQVIGSLIGAIASFYPKLDNILMRILDIFQAIPSLLLALAIAAALGTSIPNLIIAMMIARVPGAARSARAVTLPLVSQDHIEAARSYGCNDFQLIFEHILPNALGPIIVDFTISLSSTTLQVSSLSYIGLGVQPPTPEWGVLLNEAREFMMTAPHTIIFPGLAIMFTSLAFNLVGDGLRDAIDPRLRD